MPDEQHSILVVDDHPLIRRGISAALSETDDLVVCGEAYDTESALELLRTCKPDAAIVDLCLDQSSGLDLIRTMQAQYEKVKILVLTMKNEGFYAERVIRAGARGFLSKDQTPGCIVDALRAILQGQCYVSDDLAGRIISRVAKGGNSASAGSIDSLTDREITIVELIGQGLPARQIAKKLHISPKTVDSHREHIKQKLMIKDGAELSRFAVEWVRENSFTDAQM
jgi:DNA-binding NarL/FixJ family response regulator